MKTAPMNSIRAGVPVSASTNVPLVSVLMPVYNAQQYLAEAIESVLSQTFADFDFIIVDDGSSDDSASILQRYAAQDQRIKIASRPNTGIVGALNDGLKMSRGEYIARMDADDIALPQRFERQIEFLKKNSDCVMIGSRVMLIDPEGQPICEWINETTHEEIDSRHMAVGWAMVHPSVMIRRNALMDIGAYRQKYNTLEDLDLFLRLAERGRVANHPEVLLKYRQHFNSTCFSRGDKQSEIREDLYREAYARRGLQLNQNGSRNFKASPRSAEEEHKKWGWMALDAGNVKTARKHAWRLMRREPFVANSWRLMLCALRGH